MRARLLAAAGVATLVALILPGRAEPPGAWLAGDFHIHTCNSFDAWCPQNDPNTPLVNAWTLSGDIDERFREAGARDLDFLTITDHYDATKPEDRAAERSWTDPGFGAHGVFGIHAYENSLQGHAQMLGAYRLYDEADLGAPTDSIEITAPTVNAIADDLRAHGGVFQANHVSDSLTGGGSNYRAFTSCDQIERMDWKYGYDVRPDTIEVWNGTYGADAVAYWECWLQRGARIAVTGGSDSHWLSTSAAQGPGEPTTWVLAQRRDERGILDALLAGRTAISQRSPREGGAPLIIEADADGDGEFESLQGDTVPAGAALRIRGTGAGLLEVRANGRTIALETFAGETTLRAPSDAGWVRATLFAADAEEVRAPACTALMQTALGSCVHRSGALAMTSPIYLR